MGFLQDILHFFIFKKLNKFFSSDFFFQFCKLHELGILLMDLWSKFQIDIIKTQMWCTSISKMFMKNIKWGWGKHSSNLWKVHHTLLLHVVRLFDLHKQEAFAPLHNKVDLLKDHLGARVFPLIGNNYAGHNKSSPFQELNQHMHWYNARSSTYLQKSQKNFQC